MNKITVQVIEKEQGKENEKLFYLTEKVNGRVAYQCDEIKALNYANQQKPSVILLNYNLRELGTAQYIVYLMNASPDSKVIVFSNGLADVELINCLFARARGHMTYQEAKVFATKAINAVAEGEAWIPRKMVAMLLGRCNSYQ